MAKETRSKEQQLKEARQELDALLTEQGHLDEAEQKAIETDHEERMKAARSGGSITAVFSKTRSKLSGVKDRREALPYEIWSARVRVAELERDYAAERLPEAVAAVEPAREALVKFEQERLPEVEAEHKRLSAEYEGAYREAGSLEDQKRNAELRLEHLLANGPETPAMPEIL